MERRREHTLSSAAQCSPLQHNKPTLVAFSFKIWCFSCSVGMSRYGSSTWPKHNGKRRCHELTE